MRCDRQEKCLCHRDQVGSVANRYVRSRRLGRDEYSGLEAHRRSLMCYLNQYSNANLGSETSHFLRSQA
jgi:hypothetical protein